MLSEEADGAIPYRPDKATGTFRRIAKRAGLPKARLHDLRHFAATQLIGAGCDLRTVAGRLGHGQPWTTLNTYAAFLRERDQAAADHLATVLEDPASSDRRSTRGGHPWTAVVSAVEQPEGSHLRLYTVDDARLWDARPRLSAVEFALADVTEEEWDAFYSALADT